MSKIKHILDNLERSDYNQLMNSFNEEDPQHIEYEPGFFIGVHINIGNNPRLKIQETRGAWSIGTIDETSS